VSSVTVDPHDATGATVYATLAGFGSTTAFTPLLYASTDFGAHWLNITSNLTQAPANALVVDPNDANTVYIALDSGIYVTTNVSACATANCWSLLGTGLPNAPVTALAAGAQLPTGDGRRGMLRAGTYGRGLWQQPLLSAISLAQPAITVAPTSLTFAATQVATQSAAQSVTVLSNGTAPVTIRSIAISGDFVETDTCSGQTLAVNAACAVTVRFAPTATGARSGTLTIYANVSGGQATVALTGTGDAPAAMTLTPSSLTFAAALVNSTSASQIILLANTGGTASSIASIATTGDFAITANTCGTTLAASTGCSIAIAFTPTTAGTRTGALTVIDDAGTQTAQLSGSGEAPATDTLSPLSLTFAAQGTSSVSATQAVTLNNSGDVALNGVNASISGPFTVINGCGTSVPAHTACAFSVAFAPTVVGNATGALTISDTFRTQTVSLGGIGVAPAGVSLTPATGLQFAPTAVGLSSTAQTLTLTNNGGGTLTINSLKVSGDFALASTTCGGTLNAAAACTMTIVFTPSAAAARSGTVTLTDNAPSGTQSVALTGTGIDFTLTPAGVTSLTIASGSSAVYPLLLSSVPGVTGSAAVACTGAPAHATCTVTPASATLGSNTGITVTVATGLAHAQRQPLPWERVVFLALLLPLMLRGNSSRKAVRVLLFSVLLAIAGCGVGREIPASDVTTAPTPTPSGTYALTVAATSAGITRSVGLTLIVQ
jgi:hypothetical protein